MSDRNEWLRVSQRVPAVGGAYRVQLKARAAREVGLHFEVCEQHLLYWQGCATSARMQVCQSPETELALISAGLITV